MHNTAKWKQYLDPKSRLTKIQVVPRVQPKMERIRRDGEQWKQYLDPTQIASSSSKTIRELHLVHLGQTEMRLPWKKMERIKQQCTSQKVKRPWKCNAKMKQPVMSRQWRSIRGEMSSAVVSDKRIYFSESSLKFKINFFYQILILVVEIRSNG